MPKDDLFDEAVRVVLDSKRGSVSLLQRRLGIGYARASRIIEMMAGAGILGEYKGSQAREVLMTLEEYEQVRAQQAPSEAEPESAPAESAQGAEAAVEENPAEKVYATEGQQGYVSTDIDEEEDE